MSHHIRAHQVAFFKKESFQRNGRRGVVGFFGTQRSLIRTWDP